MVPAISTTDPPVPSNNFAQRNGSYADVTRNYRPASNQLPRYDSNAPRYNSNAPRYNSNAPRYSNNAPRFTPQRESLSSKMNRQLNTDEGLQTMTLYVPLPATKYDRISTVTLHVLNALNLSDIAPGSREYPIYHVHSEVERLGVSLAKIDLTSELLHHPLQSDGISLPWTYVNGAIPTPITICNATRCEPVRLEAALQEYGSIHHLTRISHPGAPHSGNWSAVLVLKQDKTLPLSITFHGQTNPMKILPFSNAPMCPTCLQADPDACQCPLPACHPSRTMPVPDAQVQAQPLPNAVPMPTTTTTPAPAPEMAPLPNHPPAADTGNTAAPSTTTAPSEPVPDNTMDVDNQDNEAPAQTTSMPAEANPA
ncbi:hypothetical protein H4S07_000893, partial [Coemansia furcata]